jgi:hypothetical protein
MFTMNPKTRTFAITVDRCPHDPFMEFAVMETFTEPINPLGHKMKPISVDEVMTLLLEIKAWRDNHLEELSAKS